MELKSYGAAIATVMTLLDNKVKTKLNQPTLLIGARRVTEKAANTK